MKTIFSILFLCFGCGSHNPVMVSAAEQSSSGLWSATVSWDANTERDLSGYKIYYGTSSGNYDDVLDVGNTTSFIINRLKDMRTYFFAVTAYDLSENESAFSSEVSLFLGTVGLKPFLSWRVDLGDTNIIEIDSTLTKIANLDLIMKLSHYRRTEVDSIKLHINDLASNWAIVGEVLFFNSNGRWVTSNPNVTILSGLYYAINVQAYHDGSWSDWAEPSKRFKILVIDEEDEIITETFEITAVVEIE